MNAAGRAMLIEKLRAVSVRMRQTGWNNLGVDAVDAAADEIGRMRDIEADTDHEVLMIDEQARMVEDAFLKVIDTMLTLGELKIKAGEDPLVALRKMRAAYEILRKGCA